MANFKEPSVSRKWIVIIAVLVIDLIVAITVVAIVLDRERDEARRAAAIAATSTTGVTSPYDFTELPDETDLDVIEEASFVSILVPDESGDLTSYGVSMELPAAQALSDAVRNAEEADTEIAATTAGPIPTGTGATAPGHATESTADATVTFVLPNRETLTFVMDLDQGFIARAGRVWRIDGDLEALVEAATAGPR